MSCRHVRDPTGCWMYHSSVERALCLAGTSAPDWTTLPGPSRIKRPTIPDRFWRNAVAWGCPSKEGRRIARQTLLDRSVRCSDATAPGSREAESTCEGWLCSAHSTTHQEAGTCLQRVLQSRKHEGKQRARQGRERGKSWRLSRNFRVAITGPAALLAWRRTVQVCTSKAFTSPARNFSRPTHGRACAGRF